MRFQARISHFKPYVLSSAIFRTEHLIALVSLLLASLCLLVPVAKRTTFTTPQAVAPVKTIKTTEEEANETDTIMQASIKAAYGKLPLSFEANQGQAESQVKFSSHGSGYGLFLTQTEAMLTLNKQPPQRTPQASVDEQEAGLISQTKQPTPTVLRMRLKRANSEARVTGTDELAGKVNYLIGDDSERWRSNVPTYARIRYQQVYKNVDLVYYGNQGRLEYDFEIAPGGNPDSIKLAFEGMQKLALDKNGDLLLKTQGGDIRWRKPVVYQELNGERREIAGRYVIDGWNREVGFKVGEYNRSRPLVIDPVLIYSTFFGGSTSDAGDGIAVDASGSAYITGRTSGKFPTTSGAFQTNYDASSASGDSFVTKLNPAGTAVVYSTYLGGSDDDEGYSIGVDADGQAHIAGITCSLNFPLLNAYQAAKGDSDFNCDAFVTKLNATGSGLIYSTYLGGLDTDFGRSIALDNAGNAYVGGDTRSQNFPMLNALQPNKAGHPVFKSINSGGSWNESSNGLTAPTVNALAVDPVNPARLFAGTDLGVYRTTDGGAGWSNTSGPIGLGVTGVTTVVIDPHNPAIVYASATAFGCIVKSTDGGSTWNYFCDGIDAINIYALAIDPVTSTTLYAGGSNQIFYKSTDGGAHWQSSAAGLSLFGSVQAIAIDPTNPSTIYVGKSSGGVYKSTNSSGNWINASTGLPNNSVFALSIDPTNTATIYAGTGSGIFKSTDAGSHWTAVNNGLIVTYGATTFTPGVFSLSIAQAVPATIYAGTKYGGIFKSTDGGASWSQVNSGLTNSIIKAVAINGTTPSIFYAGTESGADAFITKLNPAGTVLYSTYLGGNENEVGNGIAVDASGSAYLTGATSSTNFPTMKPAQPSIMDTSDGFVTKLNANGAALAYSTYLGGSANDVAQAIAVDSAGSSYVTGQTISVNFPTTAGAFDTSCGTDSICNQASSGSIYADAFLTKLEPQGSTLAYSTYLGGSREDVAYALALNSAGEVYVTGYTTSIDFPVSNAIQASQGGSQDAFILKTSTSGASLDYSTYLGRSNGDIGRGIAVDQAGNAYVTGATNSFDFQTVNAVQAQSGGSTDAFICKIGVSTDLAISKTDTRDPVLLNGELAYTITVTNHGPSTATGVRVTDALPAGEDFTSATPSQGSCSGTSVVTCELGALGVQGTAQVSLLVKPTQIGTILNTATVTGNEPDSDSANNSASQSTNVSQFPSLAGRVTDEHHNGLAGVTISLSGTQTATTITDDGGNYQFVGLAAGGTYTVNPTKQNYYFTPPSITFNDARQDLTANFTGAVCAYHLAPSSQSFSASGGSGSIAVSATGDCPWTASSNVNWITINSDTSGAGNGTVTYSVAPAIDGSRSGSIKVGGVGFAVWQEFDSCEAVSFKAQRQYSLNVHDPLLAVADFNGDGKPDLAALELLQGNDSVDVLLNNGVGGFSAPKNFLTGPASRHIAVGDVNKDGKIDLIVTDFTAVQIMLGDGAGNFGAPTNINISIYSNYVTYVADFNGDGNLDLAVLSNEFWMLFGDGAGGFSPPSSRLLGGVVAIGDFNNDHKVDLVLERPGIGVEVRPGDGTGGFGPGVPSAQMSSGNNFKVNDVNSDGNLDLISTSGVMLGDGTGYLDRPITYASAEYQDQITLGDLNNDGKLDLLVFKNYDVLLVMPGTGTGSFSAPATFALEKTPYFPVVADFDGDHKTDAAFVNRSDSSLSVLLNNCKGDSGITISGRVTPDSSIQFFQGDSLVLDGSTTGRLITSTDSAGNFSFKNLPKTGTYTLKPAANPYNRYSPESYSFVNPATDQTANFAVARRTGTISGYLLDSVDNHGVSGIGVFLSGGIGRTSTVKTDASGFYSFGNLPFGDYYYFTILPNTVGRFSVVETAFPNFAEDKQLNITVYRFNYSISGQALDDKGKPMQGVVIKASGGRNAVDAVSSTSDVNGNYNITGLPAGFDYTLTASKKNYAFDPGSAVINYLESDQTVNFGAQASRLQFSAPAYNVNESDGSATITVTRSGTTVNAAAVDYVTSDGTARQRTDYTTSSGTLNFAAGEMSKSFTILITDNAFVDGSRTINLTLNNPGGVELIAPASSLLTILDNDTATPTHNPLDDAQFFVRQQYADFLNRAPDPGGLGYWSNEINRCGTDAQCIHDRRVGVADAFFFEPEFQQTGAYIYRIYKAAIGIGPTYEQFTNDRGRVVAGPALDQTKSAYALYFVKGTAFQQEYATATTADQFVDKMLTVVRNYSGVDLSSQRSTLIGLYDGSDTGKAAILRQMADNQLVIDAEYNRSFVLMEYFGYLRRDPDQGGYDFWLGQVNRYPLRDVGIQHAMACSFITSAEYQTRFSSVVTHNNRECPQ